MSDELKELQLRAARAALEREELALQREREEHERQQRRQSAVSGALEEVTSATTIALGAGARVGSAVLAYLGRLCLMLLAWLVGGLLVTAFLYFKQVPPGVDTSFGYVGGYVLAASIFYAPWICLIAAFFRVEPESWNALLVLGVFLIGGIQMFGSPSVFAVMPDFKEHISQDVLAYAQQPGLSEQERLSRYVQYFDHVPCGKKGTANPQDDAYQEQLRLIEREHPRLNPDSPRHQPALVAKAVARMGDYQRAGYTACKALRLAADEVTVWR